ncbi:MAG: hypothetical protein RQ756_06495 [Flavobacteriaceae bacterium]|nr:hypothetical protein [Flavobacteriaceae bacterium]
MKKKLKRLILTHVILLDIALLLWVFDYIDSIVLGSIFITLMVTFWALYRAEKSTQKW